MVEALITILKSFGYPVYRQGSMSDKDVYPDTFITFWNNETPDHAHYNDTAYGTSWDFNVYVYTREKASTAYTLIDNIRAALLSAGWVVPSRGEDISSDADTHIARGIECQFLDTAEPSQTSNAGLSS